MSITGDLQSFYDCEAKKYASTRKKHRADADMILEEIKKSDKKTISILEFGCGSGRLLEQLSTLKGIKINYIGVDLSKELLKIAKKNGKNITSLHLICDDIVNHIKSCEQESFDFIIGIASFQHIPTYKERIFLMKNFYRTLKYNGKLIMTNRALSKRFFQKHKIQILKSFIEYLITLGKHNIRDIMVPRSSSLAPQKKHYRFYHMFSLKELTALTHAGGLVPQMLTYVNKEGKEVTSWKDANNSVLIASKTIFKKE